VARLPLPRLGRRRSAAATDPASLRERVRDCFFAVQHAWANRDGEALAPYVSESLRATMEQEFDELEAQYLATRLEELELHEVRVVSPPGPDEAFFDVDVAFTAREWTEDLRTGRPAGGDPDAPMRFEQLWRFARRKDGSWVIDEVAAVD
jgi:predicted lipid-binding transport protein (Tim44 family)